MTSAVRRAPNAILLLLAASLLAPAANAQPVFPEANLQVTGERIQKADAEPGNWLAHGRGYDEQRFSPLDAINAENVGKLGLAWAFPTGATRGHESTPIVADGAMFFTLPWSVVVALNAQTGQLLWTHDPKVPRAWARNACCDVINRGVALWKGNVYVASLDGRLIALDAKTGAVKWDVRTTPEDKPYTITGAPRIVKDKVIIGNGGSEYGVRGYFSAYDAATGEQAWRFYTVPGDPSKPFEHPEMEAAAKTWTGKWWEYGGGGTAWDSMAFDPELNLLYVGTGNGSPWNRAIRSPEGGDNLYLSSILAIDPDTGRLKWHYQTTPAESWDYTATQHMILAELEIAGAKRKVIMQAPKNGFFYVLDRETGKLLSAMNYVNVTWASKVDMETGRPVETGQGDFSRGPRLVFPSPAGGHNWQPMSFSPKTKLVYIPAMAEPFLYFGQRNFEYKKMAWNTGIDFAAAIAMVAQSGAAPKVNGYLKAWDPVAQKEAWQVTLETVDNGGILSTAGGLVFQGVGAGNFYAYRAETGEKVWEFKANVGMVAPPISFMAGGEQHIAVLAGWGGVPAIVGADVGASAASTHANRGHMLAFKLGGSAKMPEIAAKRSLAIAEPPPSDATAEVIKRGDTVYHTTCFQCHGVAAIASGVVADLRYSPKTVHENFKKIVLEGALESKGMASFSDLLTEADSDAVHAYVINRARQDRAAQQKAAAPAAQEN